MTARSAPWHDVADRLRDARSYWLGTSDPDGMPHAVPVWGAFVGDDLYFYSERSTAKARYLAVNPRVVVHLESAEDVVIVNGRLDDLGKPGDHGDVLDSLAAKYPDPEDAQYLPTSDADFDVLWVLRPERAMLWRLDDYDDSQARWRAT
jgi:nitroimidazol reductase NimA-like FMN-containing flavoprotein (pyridoxamine 5'-phosphate oxidase superfamily)